MYAMACTRPDIVYIMGIVNRFLSKQSREHWNALKWILRYLRGTVDLNLCFENDEPILVDYIDSVMAEDIDSRKLTLGYPITFTGEAIAWQSRLQICVTLSTTESELIAKTEACKELLWVKRFMKELGFT